MHIEVTADRVIVSMTRRKAYRIGNFTEFASREDIAWTAPAWPGEGGRRTLHDVAGRHQGVLLGRGLIHATEPTHGFGEHLPKGLVRFADR